jgi:hypothetical protein
MEVDTLQHTCLNQSLVINYGWLVFQEHGVISDSCNV